jgi:hypothetical protein
VVVRERREGSEERSFGVKEVRRWPDLFFGRAS